MCYHQITLRLIITRLTSLNCTTTLSRAAHICNMQWRRRHCCPIKMTWNIKRSHFRMHMMGLLLLALIFTIFLSCSFKDWLPSQQGLREDSVAYTMHGLHPIKEHAESNQSSLHSLWRESLFVPSKPPMNFSSHQSEVAVQSISGMEASLSTNKTNDNTLHREMGVGEQLAPNPYQYLLNEPYKCQDNNPFLILLIAVEPGHLEARNAIRQTWGNESLFMGMSFVRLFLMGVKTSPDGHPQSAIVEESLQHHDIIQQDFMDTYYNLTIKTLMGMNWVAEYCPHACYVMKTDSDMFVNTEYLIKKLLKPELPPQHNYFTGYLMRGYAPNRNKDSKWYMPPELYSSERYPIFCSGTGYVFSGDMAGKIYQASLSIRRLHLEDVYVGICLAKLRIDPVPPPNEFLFNHWRVSYSSCKYSHLITSHQFQPTELIKYWNHLQSNKHNACINIAKEKSSKFRHRKLEWERLR
ncbi:beta-1,3-galactosyltransferase 2 [Hemibagrus wyckioides]|uniref:beta-1,3-galactosyltransferase 2 n=1 Tax=Hemibagrus wyckioides TaxID=337641 RepID=UPI00266BFD6A|nr:beta-1,3-galactosyltransferase 2 [Hemibagrus wyckioides]XP_058256665.1 beta-1,3-galactosyltransferase 2 [Hemibagrus wyckioides]